MVEGKVIVIMGSEKDSEFTEPAIQLLKEFDVDHEIRISSAHKTPRKLLSILDEHEDENRIVYLTVAGRSNALSGFVDANTKFPVLACPPYSDKFAGADVFSSLRMPSGVGPLLVLDPENAALAAVKILALEDPELSRKVSSFQDKTKKKVEESDESVGKGK